MMSYLSKHSNKLPRPQFYQNIDVEILLIFGILHKFCIRFAYRVTNLYKGNAPQTEFLTKWTCHQTAFSAPLPTLFL